jgi:hypothetical protein
LSLVVVIVLVAIMNVFKKSGLRPSWVIVRASLLQTYRGYAPQIPKRGMFATNKILNTHEPHCDDLFVTCTKDSSLFEPRSGDVLVETMNYPESLSRVAVMSLFG